MKKLFLVFAVIIGITVFSYQSFALTGGQSSNKTLFQQPLVSSVTNGNTAFVSGTTINSGVAQYWSSSPGISGGTYQGVLLNCNGTPITGIALSAGATAGVVTIYDANTNLVNQNFPTEVGVQEVVFEAAVAANTGSYIDIHDAPINTVNGVVVQASGTSGVVVYTSNGVSANH